MKLKRLQQNWQPLKNLKERQKHIWSGGSPCAHSEAGLSAGKTNSHFPVAAPA